MEVGMAGRQGIKEKVHLSLYDSLRVEPKNSCAISKLPAS